MTDNTEEPNHVMLDLETLGTEPGCAILSVGAVVFDGAGPDPTERFHEKITLTSCQQAGLEMDAGTVEWWLSQDDGAQEVFNGGDNIGAVLGRFSEWLPMDAEVWAYSPQFDCAILSAAYDAVDEPTPWSYRDERCARTVSNLPMDTDADHEGVEHDALDDAINQAKMVSQALRKIDEREVRA